MLLGEKKLKSYVLLVNTFLAKHSTSATICRLCNNAPESIDHLSLLYILQTKVEIQQTRLKKDIDRNGFILKSILDTKEY